MIFEAVIVNKPFILSVYRSVSRDQIENYLFRLTCGLIENVVAEKSVDSRISEEDRHFIAEFYKYSFVGIMLDWIKQGMKEEPQVLVDKISTTMHGNITNSVRNFEAYNQRKYIVRSEQKRLQTERKIFMDKKDMAKGIAALAAGAGVAVVTAKGVRKQSVKKKETKERIEAEQNTYRNTERGKYEKNSKGIYYSNGNYEAFAVQRSRRVSRKSMHI